MASSFRLIAILFTILCLSELSSHVLGADSIGENVPITYKLNQKRTECIYEVFEMSDFVTFSVFIVEAMNNGAPIGDIAFEGPLSGNPDIITKIEEITSGQYDNNYDGESSQNPSLGRQLKKGMTSHWPIIKDSDKKVRYDKRMGIINRSLKVDWTHAGENEDAVAARSQIEAEKREAYRNKGRGPPKNDEESVAQNDRFKAKIMSKIEPYEETNAVKAAGWYRLCVSSRYHALMVEMEIRGGNRMGGIDRRTGHVHTYESKEMLDAEKLWNEEEVNAKAKATALTEEQKRALENQVKEQDLHASKSQITHLNSMVTEIKKSHQEFHRRIKSHKASAARNYESMIWSSKLETVLYIIITAVQVYTVRKWLSGNTLLGK